MSSPPPSPVTPNFERRSTDQVEKRRRRRELWLIGVVSVAIAGFTFFELRLSDRNWRAASWIRVGSAAPPE